MAYGRVALGAARSVLRSTPVGGALDRIGGAIGGLFGKAPADRNASNRLRALGKRALAGDAAARQAVFEMAARQGSKFGTINAAAVRWAQKLQANNTGASPSLGAAPIGIMAPGGGRGDYYEHPSMTNAGAVRRRRRRRSSSARRASRPRRRAGARRMSALQRKYFGRRRSTSRRR